jgi:sporulation protein YlmC with PRC-barrel domain
MSPDDVMDMQLFDCEGRRCGRVDALALDADGNIETILTGPGAWRARLPGRVGLHLPDEMIEVPWSRVDRVERGVRLNARAQDLGLGRGDDELRYLLGHLPWRDAQ